MQEHGPTETNDSGAEQRPVVELAMSKDKPSNAQVHQSSPDQNKRTAPNWAEIGIFCFTGLYCILASIFACRQWQTNEQIRELTAENNRIAERAARVQNRAALRATEITDYELLASGRMGVGVTIENSSRAKAKVQFRGAVRIEDFGIIAKWSRPLITTAVREIGPESNSIFFIEFPSMDAKIENAIKVGRKVVLAVGSFSYTDDLGNQREGSDFCWIWHRKVGKWQRCQYP